MLTSFSAIFREGRPEEPAQTTPLPILRGNRDEAAIANQ